jgi:hypothetical protein
MPNSISLTGVYLPPGKSTKDGASGGAGQDQRVEQELDNFRSELLRQKIVFEAELRRQREVYEERIEHLHRENDARADEVKNLRQMVQGLAIRVENANAAKPLAAPQTPRRAPSPVASSAAAPPSAAPSSRAGTPRAESPYRRTPSRQPSPVRGARSVESHSARPHLTTVSRNSTLARMGSVSGTPWR